MDRGIIYSGQVPLETDLLFAEQAAMVGLSKLAAAVLGTSTVVNGFGVTQTAVASMNVQVAPGEIYQNVNLEGTAYSSLAADTTHTIVKQGISLDTVLLALTAPGTAGFSINYLIQATFAETDSVPVVLPYYNASNPATAFSGPANSGAAQNTRRLGKVTLTAKAGTAAATGTQTTPAPDAGNVGLYVVSVANGATSVVNGNISKLAGASILPAGLLQAIQASSLVVGADSGAANAAVVNYSPPVSALTDGMVLWFKAAAANTGATTLNVNGLGASPVVGGAHSALQGGEIILNGKCQVVWNATLASWVLIECTGGTLQVAPGTQTAHAVNQGQFSKSLASSGFQKLPSGLIIQWGSLTTANASVTYPIAFPTAQVAVFAQVEASNNTNLNANVSRSALTGFSVFPSTAGNTGATLAILWMAIGY